MAAAISVADRSLRLVIRFLHWDQKSQRCWLLYAGGEAIGRLKEHLLTRYQHRARLAFKNRFVFINWFLIEKMACGRHSSAGSRSFIVLPGVSLGATLPRRRSRKLKLGGESVRTRRLTMSGGKDGPVLALLCTQTRDLAGDHGVGRGDVVRFGAGSDEALSRPFGDADPTCGGPLRSFGRAAVPVGERRRHEQDDGGHDDQADRRRRSRFRRDDGAAPSGRDRHGAG